MGAYVIRTEKEADKVQRSFAPRSGRSVLAISCKLFSGPEAVGRMELFRGNQEGRVETQAQFREFQEGSGEVSRQGRFCFKSISLGVRRSFPKGCRTPLDNARPQKNCYGNLKASKWAEGSGEGVMDGL